MDSIQQTLAGLSARPDEFEYAQTIVQAKLLQDSFVNKLGELSELMRIARRFGSLYVNELRRCAPLPFDVDRLHPGDFAELQYTFLNLLSRETFPPELLSGTTCRGLLDAYASRNYEALLPAMQNLALATIALTIVEGR